MRYVLGFDGGGTKTECVLMEPEGKIIARGFSGPSNPYRVGVESASREMEKAAECCLQEARVTRNDVAAIGAGLAGAGGTGGGGGGGGAGARACPPPPEGKFSWFSRGSPPPRRARGSRGVVGGR